MKLDYSLKTVKDRVALVEKILSEYQQKNITPTDYYLEILSNYIIDISPTEKHEITTANRNKTIQKRETSYEGLAMSLETGEDGIYNLTSDLGIAQRLVQEKTPLDEDDPDIKCGQLAIEQLETQAAAAVGKRKYLLKKEIIELRQNQYLIQTQKNPVTKLNSYIKGVTKRNLPEKIISDGTGLIKVEGVPDLTNPMHVSAILQNYSGLKESSYGNFDSDFWALMLDFDRYAAGALEARHTMLYDIMVYKIDGKTNAEICELIAEKYGFCYTPEYLSAIWRKKIPKIIAEYVEQRYIDWYYLEVEKGKYKKCNRCGEIKLVNNLNFSLNKSSPDGFYSICKCCRNKKKKDDK